MTDVSRDAIVIRGARQNNLKNLDLDIPTERADRRHRRVGLGQVVAGVRHAVRRRPAPLRRDLLARTRGSSSTAWTSRRSTRIEGIPPAIAIDQTNPVRTSRSTVGTMTELNDHLKLLFARAAHAVLPRLRRSRCGATRREHLRRRCSARARRRRGDPRAAAVTFPVPVPENFNESEVRELLREAGLHALLRARTATALEVRAATALALERARKARASAARSAPCADRSRWCRTASRRHRRARPRARVARSGAARRPRPRQRARRRRRDPPQQPRLLALLERAALRRLRPSLPRADPEPVLVQLAARRLRNLPRLRPHHRHRLRPRDSRREQDAARRRRQPWQTQVLQGMPGRPREVREEARHPARHALARAQRRAAQVGASKAKASWSKEASGTACKRFFEWLETKAYKMHVRVLLSRYRAYTPCTACDGARLKPEALLWRLGTRARDAALAPRRASADGVQWSDETLARCPASRSTT